MNHITVSEAPQGLATLWRSLRILLGLGLWVLAVFGMGVLFYRLSVGLGITRLGSTVPWGLWVAFYIYFIGLSA